LVKVEGSWYQAWDYSFERGNNLRGKGWVGGLVAVSGGSEVVSPWQCIFFPQGPPWGFRGQIHFSHPRWGLRGLAWQVGPSPGVDPVTPPEHPGDGRGPPRTGPSSPSQPGRKPQLLSLEGGNFPRYAQKKLKPTFITAQGGQTGPTKNWCGYLPGPKRLQGPRWGAQQGGRSYPAGCACSAGPLQRTRGPKGPSMVT